jgi:hypothetical protein
MMPSPAVEFDMAVRSVVTIDAPPAEVWSGLARLQDWKPSVVSVERLGGAAEGEEGETLRVGQRPGDSTVYVIMRTIRSLPHEWKLQTLRTEDGDATDGYVSYSLLAEQGGTRLCCAAVARCRVQRTRPRAHRHCIDAGEAGSRSRQAETARGTWAQALSRARPLPQGWG